METRNVSRTRKKTGIRIVLLILLTAIVVAGVLYEKKATIYRRGANLEAAGDYALAEEAFVLAGEFRDSPERAAYCAQGAHFVLGQAAFEEGNFALAEEEFMLAGEFPDASVWEKTSREAGHYNRGLEAYEKGDYPLAVTEFELAGYYSDAPSRLMYARKGVYYQNAVALMEAGDYSGALEQLEDVDDFSGTSEAIRVCNYYLGLESMNDGELDKAIDYFQNAENYEDAKHLYGVCVDRRARELFAAGSFEAAASDFAILSRAAYLEQYPDCQNYLKLCEAEIQFGKGNLVSGMDIYYSLPADFRPEEFDVAARLSWMKTYEPFYNVCGQWGSDTYNISAQSGRWVASYRKGVLKDMVMNISCTLNEDGTVTLKGDAAFYCFTSYPEYFDTGMKMHVSWSIPDIRWIPSSWKIDEYTNFGYTGGVLRIDYVRNEFDTCSSHVTYNIRQ